MLFIQIARAYRSQKWFGFERLPKPNFKSVDNTRKDDAVKHHAEAMNSVHKAQRDYFLSRGPFF